ncbi:MAG: hypothetical protein J0L88_00730 [Xanthomonadales bacterium]|nr:hypothetical protein [Xanthomonadales bacterium]
MTRALAAAPDAITAACFVVLWVAPFALGVGGVRNAMLVMLVEFILMHAAGALGGIVFAERTTRTRRLVSIAGMGMFYLVFVGSFALAFKAWWPFLAFGWLLVGKFVLAFDPARTPAQRREQMMQRWGVTALSYLLGVFVTVMVPLPRLGITADVVPRLGLSGSGLWVEKPHTVIAFGAIYFGLLAWHALRQARAAAKAPAAAPPLSGSV